MSDSVAKLCLTLASPWTIACWAPRSLEFSRQEFWGGLPFPSPEDLPDPGIKPRSPALQADSLPAELWGKPHEVVCCVLIKLPLNFADILLHLWRDIGYCVFVQWIAQSMYNSCILKIMFYLWDNLKSYYCFTWSCSFRIYFSFLCLLCLVLKLSHTGQTGKSERTQGKKIWRWEWHWGCQFPASAGFSCHSLKPQSVVCGLAASASPESLVYMQNLRPHPRPTGLKSAC